jgi:hypothetical protein
LFKVAFLSRGRRGLGPDLGASLQVLGDRRIRFERSLMVPVN